MPYVCGGVATQTNELGVIFARYEPPAWAEGRAPDSFVATLGPTGSTLETQAKLFTPIVWSLEGGAGAQIRVRREDTHEWAMNQKVSCFWVAVWVP